MAGAQRKCREHVVDELEEQPDLVGELAPEAHDARMDRHRRLSAVLGDEPCRNHPDPAIHSESIVPVSLAIGETGICRGLAKMPGISPPFAARGEASIVGGG